MPEMTFDVDQARNGVAFDDDPLAAACDEIEQLREERDELAVACMDLQNELATCRGRLRALEARHIALQILWRGLPPESHVP